MKTPIQRCVSFSALVCACAFLAACAAPQAGGGKREGGVALSQVLIQDQFRTNKITPDNLDSLYQECLGGALAAEVRARALADVALAGVRSFASVLSNTRRAGFFVIENDVGACVQETEAGYPVLAADVFVQSINPGGVAAPVLLEWQRKMALKLTQQGKIKVAYQYANGNASEARYWVDKADKGYLFYESSFVKQSNFNPANYDFVFSDPGLDLVTTTAQMIRGVAQKKKSFIRHLTRPVPPSGGTQPSADRYPKRATPLPSTPS